MSRLIVQHYELVVLPADATPVDRQGILRAIVLTQIHPVHLEVAVEDMEVIEAVVDTGVFLAPRPATNVAVQTITPVIARPRL